MVKLSPCNIPALKKIMKGLVVNEGEERENSPCFFFHKKSEDLEVEEDLSLRTEVGKLPKSIYRFTAGERSSPGLVGNLLTKPRVSSKDKRDDGEYVMGDQSSGSKNKWQSTSKMSRSTKKPTNDIEEEDSFTKLDMLTNRHNAKFDLRISEKLLLEDSPEIYLNKIPSDQWSMAKIHDDLQTQRGPKHRDFFGSASKKLLNPDQIEGVLSDDRNCLRRTQKTSNLNLDHDLSHQYNPILKPEDPYGQPELKKTTKAHDYYDVSQNLGSNYCQDDSDHISRPAIDLSHNNKPLNSNKYQKFGSEIFSDPYNLKNRSYDKGNITQPIDHIPFDSFELDTLEDYNYNYNYNYNQNKNEPRMILRNEIQQAQHHIEQVQRDKLSISPVNDRSHKENLIDIPGYAFPKPGGSLFGNPIRTCELDPDMSYQTNFAELNSFETNYIQEMEDESQSRSSYGNHTLINKVKGKLDTFGKRQNIYDKEKFVSQERFLVGDVSQGSNIYDSNYMGPNNFFSNYMKDLKKSKQYHR